LLAAPWIIAAGVSLWAGVSTKYFEWREHVQDFFFSSKGDRYEWLAVTLPGYIGLVALLAGAIATLVILFGNDRHTGKVWRQLLLIGAGYVFALTMMGLILFFVEFAAYID
jgi:hypothetical protein